MIVLINPNSTEATVTNAAARINGGLRKLSGRSQIVYNDNL